MPQSAKDFDYHHRTTSLVVGNLTPGPKLLVVSGSCPAVLAVSGDCSKLQPYNLQLTTLQFTTLQFTTNPYFFHDLRSYES